jgi:molybdopterin-guanine dinucleotide biosynthesis protein B
VIEKNRPRIVSFIGWSNSGKTTLITALIAECRRRGLACAAAKCTRHGGDFEAPGKDSARYREAGAAPVAFVGTGKEGLTALFMPTPAVTDRAWLESLFPGAALILVEGLEVEGSLRVLVDKPGEEPKRPLEICDLVVTENAELRSRVEAAGGMACPPSDPRGLYGKLEELWTGK